MKTMAEDMAEGMFTALAQPTCLRCATRHSWLASLSSQGHLPPALFICGIWKRDWAQQLLQPWADPLSRPHISMKDNVFGQEQVSLDKNSALLLFLFTLWWNPPHTHTGGYDFREILALFSQSLCWAAPLTPRRAASPAVGPCLAPEMPRSHFCRPHGLCGSFTVALSLHNTSLFQIPLFLLIPDSLSSHIHAKLWTHRNRM